ncbi:MAG TPA: cysteine desulfurase family protein [Iamia sp.]|nr:cysteine desulfurase family protein [Iamia sp.]
MAPDPVVPTYLDHAASTPMRPEAVEAMVPFLTTHHGNPSGSHAAARHARRAVDDARDAVAALVGCRPGEVVFTSGGTEADVTALVGASLGPGPLAVSAVEHAAVRDTAHALAARGVPVVELPVDGRGRVDLDAVPANAALISVGLANNEVGTIHPLDALAERAPGAVIHTDAVQAAAWLDLPTLAAPAHLVALSAHKLGGPKGVGALVVREGTACAPLVTGGGQERGRRSGTPNVPGIVGFGVAARMAVEERAAKAGRVAALRDRLATGLLAAVGTAVETVVPAGSDRNHVLPGHLHLCLPGTAADEVLFLLDQEGVAATAASSCASGATSPSHVLAALGVADDVARGSLRLTLGWSTTEADVDRALTVIPPVVAKAAA